MFVGGADVSHLVATISIAVIALVLPMVLTYREWIGAESTEAVLSIFRISGCFYNFRRADGDSRRNIHSSSDFLKGVRKIYIPSLVISMGLFFSVIIQRFLRIIRRSGYLFFSNPDLDPHGSGYNVIQSKIAIGSGGFFGKGFLNGSQSQLGFLPEKTSDFIFPVVAEEWGFFGAIVVLGLLGYIVYKGIQTALEAKDKFGALLAAGISCIFFFHILINIGMVLGIMPVTGLPLCLVSYGGSNLMMCLLSIGILINIRMRKFVY